MHPEDRRYLLGALRAAPTLPAFAREALHAKATIPRLPEASHPRGGTQGSGEMLRLLTLGESTMAGVGVERHADGFTGALARRLTVHTGRPVDWVVHARNGATARDTATELLPATERNPPDIIVVGLGANDTFQLRPPWRWRRHLHALVHGLSHRFGTVPVVFAHFPPVGDFPAFTPRMQRVFGGLADLHHAALQRVAAAHPHVVYMDEPVTFEAWAERAPEPVSPEALFCDGVHPSALAYGVWGEMVADHIHEAVLRP